MYAAEPLSVDHHLKVVREITWEARARWNDLGLELAVPQGKLQVCVIVCLVYMYAVPAFCISGMIVPILTLYTQVCTVISYFYL